MKVKIVGKNLKYRKQVLKPGDFTEMKDNDPCTKALIAMGRAEVVKPEPEKKKAKKKKSSKYKTTNMTAED